MAEYVVAAEPRSEMGKNANRRLRAAEKIPAVLYGGKDGSRAVAVSPVDITKILRSASGENTLFDLDVEGKKRKVILKEYQVQPVTGRLLHADLYEVALDRMLEVDVHIELHGTPVGVKVQGGILDFITREIEVECLPTDIPEKIVVDVSGVELGKHVRVSDLELPDRVTCLTEPEVVIVHVVAPRAEAEETAAEGVEGDAAAQPAEASATPEGEDKK